MFTEVEEILSDLPWDSLPAALRFILGSAPADSSIRVVRENVSLDRKNDNTSGLVLSLTHLFMIAV